MCGINGFNFHDEELIKKMNMATRHRGPDDTGYFFSPGWSFGHNRLAIIDLSQAGHQPMKSVDGRYVIIFNGEIYNFQEIRSELVALGRKFFSKSDTEVILNAYIQWGEKCLEKLNGMFAFAILDSQNDEVFIARDRAGIKPLYYYYRDGRIIFSSEIKAILEHKIDRIIDMDALNMYFRLLYVPAPLTIYKHIYKLEPGHYGVIKNGEILIKKYWDYGNSPEINDWNNIKSEISRLLHDSVKRQMISDRPIGVFLSGGLDSTIVTGLMSSYNSQVNTFSTGFEIFDQQEKYNQDMEIARRSARHFGTNHHELVITEKDIKENLEKVIYHMDEPVSNGTQIVTMLLAKFTTDYVKVALGGDGGDELFGGYNRYYINYLINRFQKIPIAIRKNFLTESLFRLVNHLEVYNKINMEPGAGRYLDFFSQKEKVVDSILRPAINRPKVLFDHFENKYFKDSQVGFLRQFMRTDLKSWLADESLVRSDKMSMAYGLEQRVPILDHRLIEYADSISIDRKIQTNYFDLAGKNFQGKKILKEAMKDYIPDFVYNQPKRGWFSPASKWLRGTLKNEVKEILSPGYCTGTQAFLDFNNLQKLLDDHITGQGYHLNTLWSALTFQIWYRKFMEDK